MKAVFTFAVLVFGIVSLVGCIPNENNSISGVNVELNLWNKGVPKSAIVDFVSSVTEYNSPNYLPPEDRIATFDMDGTIMCEKPLYVLFAFAVDQIKNQIEKDPSLVKSNRLYKAIAEKDYDYFYGNILGKDGLYDVLLYATDGMSDEEYQEALEEWLLTPDERFGVSPHKLLYEPVLELIDYLKAHDFQVYICSGSDPEFTRIAASDCTGIPPEHIIGTMILSEWTGDEFIRRHKFIEPVNDEAGKPVNIRNKIGRVPVVAVGNSRGDLEMLNYSKTAGHSLQLIVNHDDPDREYEYSVEKMKKLCAENDWIEISMKDDFKTVFNN